MKTKSSSGAPSTLPRLADSGHSLSEKPPIGGRSPFFFSAPGLKDQLRAPDTATRFGRLSPSHGVPARHSMPAAREHTRGRHSH